MTRGLSMVEPIREQGRVSRAVGMLLAAAVAVPLLLAVVFGSLWLSVRLVRGIVGLF